MSERCHLKIASLRLFVGGRVDPCPLVHVFPFESNCWFHDVCMLYARAVRF